MQCRRAPPPLRPAYHLAVLLGGNGVQGDDVGGELQVQSGTIVLTVQHEHPERQGGGGRMRGFGRLAARPGRGNVWNALLECLHHPADRVLRAFEDDGGSSSVQSRLHRPENLGHAVGAEHDDLGVRLGGKDVPQALLQRAKDGPEGLLFAAEHLRGPSSAAASIGAGGARPGGVGGEVGACAVHDHQVVGAKGAPAYRAGVGGALPHGPQECSVLEGVLAAGHRDRHLDLLHGDGAQTVRLPHARADGLYLVPQPGDAFVQVGHSVDSRLSLQGELRRAHVLLLDQQDVLQLGRDGRDQTVRVVHCRTAYRLHRSLEVTGFQGFQRLFARAYRCGRYCVCEVESDALFSR